MDIKVLASEWKASLGWVCRAIVASGFVQMVHIPLVMLWVRNALPWESSQPRNEASINILSSIHNPVFGTRGVGNWGKNTFLEGANVCYPCFEGWFFVYLPSSNHLEPFWMKCYKKAYKANARRESPWSRCSHLRILISSLKHVLPWNVIMQLLNKRAKQHAANQHAVILIPSFLFIFK